MKFGEENTKLQVDVRICLTSFLNNMIIKICMQVLKSRQLFITMLLIILYVVEKLKVIQLYVYYYFSFLGSPNQGKCVFCKQL